MACRGPRQCRRRRAGGRAVRVPDVSEESPMAYSPRGQLPAARLREVGLGTTDGYLFLYDTNATNNLNIYRVDNEGVTSLGRTSVPALNPATGYRFTFQGTGGTFVGQVFTLSNPTVPIATATNATADTTYTSGFPGLLDP